MVTPFLKVMELTMTVWMYYLRREGFDTTQLYAFTNNKKLSKEFSEQRDPERLIMIKREYTKDQWNALNSQRPGLRIIEGQFYTKGFVYGSRRRVRIVCTAMEEEKAILRADSIWEEASRYLFDARALKKEYLVALEKLMFMRFYCFYIIKGVQFADYFYEPYYSNFEGSEDFVYEEFKENLCSYDELRIFLHMFKDTFSDKG